MSKNKDVMRYQYRAFIIGYWYDSCVRYVMSLLILENEEKNIECTFKAFNTASDVDFL